MNEEELVNIKTWHRKMLGRNVCQGCYEIWPCDTEQVRRAYIRLRNAALAIIENPDHVDVGDVVTMLQYALGEEQ